MAENKVLLAVSKSMPTQGNRGEWTQLKQPDLYINGIDSGEYDESAEYSSDELAKDVTGYPSAWARCNFFKLAIEDYKNDRPQSLLNAVYRNLREEWKGLIALIATESSKIDKIVRPLFNEKNSDFSLADLLGQVLFLDDDNKDSLWYDKEINEGKTPFIQLITYNGDIIGASCPDTLIFPAVKYCCNDVKWFDKDKQRFVAPQLNELTDRQLKDLYLVLSKIEKGFDSGMLDKNQCANFDKMIDDWMRDIEKEAEKRNPKVGLSKTSVLGSPLPFVGRLGLILSCDDKIYEYEDGRYGFSERAGATEVNPDSYLLPNNSEVCELSFGSKSEKKQPKDLDVYALMPADDGNGRHFFPFPLTEKGLLKLCTSNGSLSYTKIEELLKPFDHSDINEASKPHLEAVLVGDVLQVTLYILVENDLKGFKRQFQVKKDEKFNKKSCILWPNFVSSIWRDYYLYTECLEDVLSGVVTKPFYSYYPNERGDDSSFVISKNEDEKTKLVVGLVDSGNGYNVEFNQDGGKWTQDEDFKAEKIVKDRGNSSAKHHYDVWHSNKPIAGVTLTIKDAVNGTALPSGYLLFKQMKNIHFDVTDDARQVTLGMDFGSNNSCVYFKKKRGAANAEPLEFRNLRVFALGEDLGDDHKNNAKLDELLFFQNEPKVGQFKSWVVMTDKALEIPSECKNRAVSGGMSIFEPNLAIRSIDTQRGVMDIENVGNLYYNMKWRAPRNDDFGGARTAFVDSVWCQAVANLFTRQLVPTEFKWSYPGAFIEPLKRGLCNLYTDVVRKHQPFCGYSNIKVASVKEAMTEAASVLSSIGPSVDSSNFVIAMDIGGSTTDLLVWYQDKELKDRVVQSSVCMAAGSVTSLFENSDNLRKAMISFQREHKENVPVASMDKLQGDKDLSYYYVNTIFDIVAEHCHEAWTMDLYEEFAKGANKSIESFALPAYIAGFLTFYAGMLLHHILKENNITTLKNVAIHPVGKGSRIIDWLKTSSLGGEDYCNEYLQNCLRAGLRDSEFDQVELTFEFEKDPKSVVAKGLVLSSPSTAADVEQIILFGEQGLVNKRTNSEVDMDLNLQDKYAEVYEEHLRLESLADNPFPVFKAFCDVFLKYLKDNDIVEGRVIKDLRSSLGEMKPNLLARWISRQPTFTDAQEEGEAFEFKESYLVLESLYFLEEYLIPIVTQRD